MSAGDGQVDIAAHVGIPGTAVDGLQIGDTAQVDVGSAGHVGHVTAAIQLVEYQRTDGVATAIPDLVDVLLGLTADATLGVRAAEGIVDGAAVEIDIDRAGAVCRRAVGQEAHMGARVRVAVGKSVLTVTAAEDGTYLIRAVHHNLRSRYGGSITTAIDIFYTGQFATVDDDIGLLC